MRLRLGEADLDRLAGAVTARKPDPGPSGWLERAAHRRVLVHTTSSQTIEGTLTLAAADGVLLWSARLMSKDPQVDLAGEVFIPRDQVAFVQTVRS